jgi:hypothetical protein
MTLLMAGSACATVYLLHRSASRHFTTVGFFSLPLFLLLCMPSSLNFFGIVQAASVWAECIMRQKPLRGRLVHVQPSGVLRFQHVPAYTRVWELLRLENTKPASMSDTIKLKLLGATPTSEGADWLRKHVLDRQVVLRPVGRSHKWQQSAQDRTASDDESIIIGIVERRDRWLLWRSDVTKELVQQSLAVLDEEVVIGEETSQHPKDVRRTVKYIEQLSQHEKRRRWSQLFRRWFGRSKQR